MQMKNNPQTLWLLHYWLVSKTAMGKKLLPNLHHKPKNKTVTTLQSLFNSHQSQWHADWQTETANTSSCLFNYYKSLWTCRMEISHHTMTKWVSLLSKNNGMKWLLCRWPRTKGHTSISTTPHISTSWTRYFLRSCKDTQALISLGEYDTRRVSNEKRLPKKHG